MAEDRSHDIPDLDLPPPRSVRESASLLPAKAAPAGASHPPAKAAPDQAGFGMELDRGHAMSNPPPSARVSLGAMPASGRQVAIAIASDDDFDMEIDRGGAVVSRAPAMSTRPSGPASTRSHVSMPASGSMRSSSSGSGLDVMYRRMDPRAEERGAQGPSSLARLAAVAVPIALGAGTLALLVKFMHRHGGRSVMALLPHAFDASSTVQSGAFALTALVLAIALGFTGLRIHPRSYGMLASAVLLVLASLAMVTVTLVSLEEQPSPPDGALLIPYVVPLAVVLLGFGVGGRGPSLFLRGGTKRAGAALAGIAGGALVFLAVEISALARLLQ